MFFIQKHDTHILFQIEYFKLNCDFSMTSSLGYEEKEQDKQEEVSLKSSKETDWEKRHRHGKGSTAGAEQEEAQEALN